MNAKANLLNALNRLDSMINEDRTGKDDTDCRSRTKTSVSANSIESVGETDTRKKTKRSES